MALRFARDLGFTHVDDGARLSILIRVYERTEDVPLASAVDKDDSYTVSSCGLIEHVTLAGARVRVWAATREPAYENGSGPGRLVCLLCSQEFAATERGRHEATSTHQRMTR